MKLLVIDANSLINRSYYAIQALTNTKGEPTNAIYGFLRVLIVMMEEVSPNGVVAAFDVKGPTFRHQQYPEYKADRKGMPDDLARQIAPLQEILKAMGMHVVEKEGFEADDLLGTLSVSAQEQGWECVLATGDRDAFQLIDEKVQVRFLTNRKAIYYDAQKFKEEYGVTPKEYIEVKALMGDPSDHIPGVAGIGKKTAFSLIQKYHDLDTLFREVPISDLPARTKNLLLKEESKKMAYMSRELSKIVTDVKIQTDMGQYRLGAPDRERLNRLFQDLDFHRFFDTIKKECHWLFPPKKREKVKTVDDPSLSLVLQILEKEKTIDFIWKQEQLFFQTAEGILCCKTDAKKTLRAILRQLKQPFRTFDAKWLYRFCLDEKIPSPPFVFSAEIAAYLLDAQAKSYALSILLEQYKVGKNVQEEYEEIAGFSDLCNLLHQKLEEEDMLTLFQEVEIPLCEALASMEKAGVEVDRDGLEAFGVHLHYTIDRVSEEIYQLAGETFNINSPRSLGGILFDKLGLPHGKKSKSGNYSTNVEVLEKLEPYHPIIGKILEYRRCNKLYSTYVQGMLKLIREDGKIHSVFQQTETRTGRISSKEPNIQNIPTRTELGNRMREFFIAQKGCVLVDADYSQIELRVLAHLSQDERMLEAFRQKEDIHAITASEVFHLDPSLVPTTLRYRAKAINFGIIYGISAFSLANDLNVSNREAQQYIDRYLKTYRGVQTYMEQTVKQAKATGEVHTMFGRRRKIPELSSKNMALRGFGERVARNTPIQGTAADIIKMAMIRVYRRLQKEKMETKLILQVHDELILEAPEKEAPHAMELLKEEMEQAATLSVPLQVDIAMGKSWKEAKP